MTPDFDDSPPTPRHTPTVALPAEPASTNSSRRRLMLLLGAMGAPLLCSLACLAAVLVSIAREFTSVTVIVGDEAYSVDTRAKTVGDLLREMNVVLAEGDVLSLPPESALTPGIVVEVSRAREVRLVVDGESRVLRTTLTSPAAILTEAGVSFDDGDRVVVDGTETNGESLALWPVIASRISVKHAVPLHITDGEEDMTIHTTDVTVGEALFNAGVTLYLADVVTPDISTSVSAGLQVTIRRASPITIRADGVSLETRSRGDTVSDALADAGVALMGLDYAIPGEEARLVPGMSIRVIRVTEEVLVEQETTPFETVYQADETLELDQRRLVQSGQNGVVQTRVRVRYENSMEISRQPEGTTVVQAAADEIVAYGTAIVLRTVDTPDGPRQYWRHIRMYATSYRPVDGDNITGTGEILRKGIVAVVPGTIPYFTEVYVPGYGVGLVADSGGGLPNSDLWIDLGYGEDDYQSWHQYVDVYLLTPVPARINYILPE